MIKWLRRKSLRNEINLQLFDRTRTQIKAFTDIGRQLFSAIESGNLELANELVDKRDLLPCPTCGRNQPPHDLDNVENLYKEYLALGGK